MKQPRICAVITANHPEAIKRVEPLVDLFEVRIDYIGASWTSLVKLMKKPWLACNRSVQHGGLWRDSEARRIAELLTAVELGASIIDIDMETPDLSDAIRLFKSRARCLVSYHDWQKTPPLPDMQAIVRQQIADGADICKVVTTAQTPDDNMAVLQLIAGSTNAKIVSFAMGPLGVLSRVLSPLVGGEFTYASVEPDRESAPGQLAVVDLRKIYDLIKGGK